MTFSIIDFLFIGLIGLLMIRCFLKGFISELLSMAGIVLGLMASLFLYKNGGSFLRNTFWPDWQTVPDVVAFVALFVIVFVIVKILENILKDIIDKVNLGSADSYIGIAFGLAEGIVVVSLVLFLLKIQPIFVSDDLLANSLFANLFLPLITGRGSVPGV